MPISDELYIKPSNIETIDTGFYEHIKDKFNIHTITNAGFKKVPVIWLGSERAFQVKADKEIRDSVGKLKLPLITIERTGMAKDPSFKGVVQADIRHFNDAGRAYRGGAFRVKRRINQEKTSQFQNNKNARRQGVANRAFPEYGRKVVYDEYFVPVPTYVAITYSITLRCEYQQQMNQMLTPFITRTGQVNHFIFEKNGHRYESFIQQDFSQTNNLANLSEEERSFTTKVDIKVLGYLIGDDINEERPKVIKRETIVEGNAPIEVVLQSVSRDEVDFDNLQNYRRVGDKFYVTKTISDALPMDILGYANKEGIINVDYVNFKDGQILDTGSDETDTETDDGGEY